MCNTVIQNKCGQNITAKQGYLVQYLRRTIKISILEMILRYNTSDNIGPYFIKNLSGVDISLTYQGTVDNLNTNKLAKVTMS